MALEKTVGEESLHFDNEILVSYVAIATAIMIVIGGFSAEILTWLAHKTVRLHYPTTAKFSIVLSHYSFAR